MKDLIERLEKASEGARELDERIAQHLGWKRVGAIQWITPEGAEEYCGKIPYYSTSIDAAMTLVPEGMLFKLWCGSQPCSAAVHFPDEGQALPGITMFSAATPALALCIAVLHSRSVEEPKE